MYKSDLRTADFRTSEHEVQIFLSFLQTLARRFDSLPIRLADSTFTTASAVNDVPVVDVKSRKELRRIKVGYES